MRETLSILVIDDSPVVFRIIKKMLEKFNFRFCTQAFNGKEGIDLAEQYNPDIIILDIAMPVMDGFETANYLLAKDPNRKIILSSSVNDDNTKQKAYAAGVKYFLPKPFHTDELLYTIQYMFYQEISLEDKVLLLINCLGKAFLKVAQEIASLWFVPYDEPYTPNENNLKVIIGVMGLYKGNILFDVSENVAHKIAEGMNDEHHDTYTYLAEFANVVAGNAITSVNNMFKENGLTIIPPLTPNHSEFATAYELANSQNPSISRFYAGKQGSVHIKIQVSAPNV